jgi:ketosteroid isomerase-like protein
MDPVQHRSGRHFYERHLAYLQAHDVEGLIGHHYHDDALLVTFDATVRGREALTEHFHRYLDRLGRLELVSTDNFTATGDTIFLEATVTTAQATARVYDAFVLRDGKIAYHFTGVIGPR